MSDSTEIRFPDGTITTKKKEADRLGITIQAMRWRIRKWGLNDPRTFAGKDITLKGKKRSRHDGVVYECPFFDLKGSVEECCEYLGIGAANFKNKIREFGVDSPNTWFNKKQTRIYRRLRVYATKGGPVDLERKRLLKEISGWKGNLTIQSDGRVVSWK